ncbi:hypothetical protein J4461_02525 [Candidatus Pacearchaeota archaeon]|nr:hypothetical protein [Candidatus Pacearchaeota archaeon]
MNKKGENAGNQTMVVYFLFLVFIIAGGIALGVSIFYGEGIDLRANGASIINRQIQLCLSEKDIDWKNGTFTDECELNKEIMQDDPLKFIIKICSIECEKGKVLFQSGSNFEACDLKGKNKYYPQCTSGFVSHEEMKYEIITGIGQRVKESGK